MSTDTTDVLPTKRRNEDTDAIVMDTKLKIIEILKVLVKTLLTCYYNCTIKTRKNC